MSIATPSAPERLPFPQLLQRFQENTARERPEHVGRAYRGLVIPGSLQASTAALLIAHFNPDAVAFLLTAQSSTMPDQVQTLLDMLGPSTFQPRALRSTWVIPKGDHLSPLTMYQGLRAIVREWEAKGFALSAIAVDVTGGKVPMTAGLAKAAHVLGLATVYIDSEYANGRYIDGTQFLELPPDPYVEFGDIDRNEAHEFYCSHDYATAARLFAGLAEHVGNLQGDQLWADLSAAYADWEAFKLGAAEEKLRALLDAQQVGLNNAQKDGVDNHIGALAAVRPLVEAQRPERRNRASWEGVPSFERAMDRFAQKQLALLKPTSAPDSAVPALMSMLYANALRRQTQGRLDTAALLLYRCLELMSQQRLAFHNVFAEWARDPLQKLAQQHPQLTELAVIRNRKGSIALYEGFAILKSIGDQFGVLCDLDQIAERTEARNKSLLAHGFSYIGETTYSDFLKLVDTALGHWCTVAGVSWDKNLGRCTFLLRQQ